MKKIILLILLLYGQLFASDIQSTLKIYHQIFSAMLHKEKVRVYTSDRELLHIFKHSKRIILVQDPKKADIVLIGNTEGYEKLKSLLGQEKKQKIIFATDYHVLKNDAVVGALYWKKGRSQLLFVKPRLKQFNITLPKAYEHFIVDRL